MDQVKQYDAVVIGAGLSGLTAASLLGKRGLRVAVVEHHRSPGGSCGAFKRGDALFDQGSAMLFGFGEEGFNAHRFVFSCLEEPFAVIKHELLRCGAKQASQQFSENWRVMFDPEGHPFCLCRMKQVIESPHFSLL